MFVFCNPCVHTELYQQKCVQKLYSATFIAFPRNMRTHPNFVLRAVRKQLNFMRGDVLLFIHSWDRMIYPTYTTRLGFWMLTVGTAIFYKALALFWLHLMNLFCLHPAKVKIESMEEY